MKLQVIKERQYFLTIPKQIVLAKGWSKGQNLKFKISNKGDLVIYE